MSTDRDVTRIVRSWLEVGVTALPDRVLDSVLDQLPMTSQRRARWPARRFREMSAFTKFAVAAAAVVVVAFVGINLLPARSIVGPGSSPAASPSPTPTPKILPSSGSLDAGTYHVNEGSTPSVRYSITVPAGWSSTESSFVYKDRGSVAPAYAPGSGPGDVMFVTWSVSHVYADACKWQGSLADAGTTVDQLANLLVAQKGRVASAATDVTLGGLPAKRIELTNPAPLHLETCDNSVLRFWPDPGPNEAGGLCCTIAGSTDVVYVVNVAGHRLAVVARHQPDSLAADLAELDAVVASLRFDVPAASPSPASPSASR